MPDREPLVDRVRAEYERRRQERDAASLAANLAADEEEAANLPPDPHPPLLTRPHDWLHEPAPKEASMDEAITVIVGTEDGKEDQQDLEEHLREWHRLPLGHSWDDEHLVRVHEQDHKEGGTFDYHAHPIDQ